jgi:hypothetical protein
MINGIPTEEQNNNDVETLDKSEERTEKESGEEVVLMFEEFEKNNIPNAGCGA